MKVTDALVLPAESNNKICARVSNVTLGFAAAKKQRHSTSHDSEVLFKLLGGQ